MALRQRPLSQWLFLPFICYFLLRHNSHNEIQYLLKITFTMVSGRAKLKPGPRKSIWVSHEWQGPNYPPLLLHEQEVHEPKYSNVTHRHLNQGLSQWCKDPPQIHNFEVYDCMSSTIFTKLCNSYY